MVTVAQALPLIRLDKAAVLPVSAEAQERSWLASKMRKWIKNAMNTYRASDQILIGPCLQTSDIVQKKWGAWSLTPRSCSSTCISRIHSYYCSFYCTWSLWHVSPRMTRSDEEASVESSSRKPGGRDKQAGISSSFRFSSSFIQIKVAFKTFYIYTNIYTRSSITIIALSEVIIAQMTVPSAPAYFSNRPYWHIFLGFAFSKVEISDTRWP